MNKGSRAGMYQKFIIIDIIVAVISLIALVALIFVIKYYNDKTSMEQNHIISTSNIIQETISDGSINELLKYLSINEVNSVGWIELYNNEKSSDIDLSNYYITVNGRKKYTFLEGDIIEAGEFICVEGLGLLGNTEHDIIGLFDEKGNNFMNIMLPRLKNGESYGCREEGYNNYCYLTESKERTNSESEEIIKDKLNFSVPGGFYDESFMLELTAPEGMTIYYTLDGSQPSNQSEAYKEPIIIQNKSGSNIQYANVEGINYKSSYRPSSISMGMVVRAIAVDGSGISVESKTQSYFIGLKEASDLKNIPVLSITASSEDLFNYFDGIYVSGRSYEDALARGENGAEAANYMNGWEKKVNVEYFEPCKDKTYEGSMSIKIINDISVSSPQKSLLLTAEGGAFAGSSLVNYYNDISNRLVVQTNGKDNNSKIREFLAGRLLTDTTVGTPDIMPCIVFINGEYWGGYMLRAEYDEKYISKHYNVSEEDVLIAQKGKITNQPDYQHKFDELYSFIVNNDLKDNQNYAWVKAHMDVQNYLQYICANMYLANAEFNPYNLTMWRTITEEGTGYEDGKWRFLMPRLDNTMKNGEGGKIATSSINTFLQTGVTEEMFFRSLLRNDEFGNQLVGIMTEMADDIFAKERVNSLLFDISSQLRKMSLMSYKRFVGNQGDVIYTSEIDKIESFFQNRNEYILLYAKEVKGLGSIPYDGDDVISN